MFMGDLKAAIAWIVKGPRPGHRYPLRWGAFTQRTRIHAITEHTDGLSGMIAVVSQFDDSIVLHRPTPLIGRGSD